MSYPRTIAKQIITQVCGEQPLKIWREKFTHSSHVIFSAQLTKKEVVIRMNKDSATLNSTIKNIQLCQKLGLPTQKIISHSFDKNQEFSWLLLERLPGRDLKYELPNMSDRAVKNLAKKIVSAQKKLQALPRVKQFGAIGSGWHSKADPVIFDSWIDFVRQLLKSNKAPKSYLKIADTLKPEFKKLTPKYLYDDWTTKNVLIENQKLVGLIDLDWIFSGDVMYWLGFVRTTLLYDLPKKELRYFDALIAELQPSEQDLKRANFYTAVTLFDFIRRSSPTKKLRLRKIQQQLIALI